MTRSVGVVGSLMIERAATARVEDAALSNYNSCRWRHNWGKWSNSILKKMMYEFSPGVNFEGVERVQRRTCSKCNKTEERQV